MGIISFKYMYGVRSGCCNLNGMVLSPILTYISFSLFVTVRVYSCLLFRLQIFHLFSCSAKGCRIVPMFKCSFVQLLCGFPAYDLYCRCISSGRVLQLLSFSNFKSQTLNITTPLIRGRFNGKCLLCFHWHPFCNDLIPFCEMILHVRLHDLPDWWGLNVPLISASTFFMPKSRVLFKAEFHTS